jgi:hypothetical protein
VHESANSRLPERVKLAYDQMILSL